MKRWRDGGGFGEDEHERRRREEAAREPLAVQALAPQGRGRRFVLPLAIGAVALLFVLATLGRYVDFFGSGTTTPAPPTPVPWSSAAASPGATPAPDATPAPVVTVTIAYQRYLLVPGDRIKFKVTLANTSGRSLTLEPCPTYRVYVPGSASNEPDRLLNCAATSGILLQGESLSFAMEYTIPADVGPGEQLLVWELTGGLRGSDSETLSMDEAPTSSPS